VPEQTRASPMIEHSRRDVFVSSYPGQAGGLLAEPIGVRIRSNSDPDETTVLWFKAKQWKAGELQQWLEEATDLVLLLDDDLIGALREARADTPVDASQAGRELIVVLGVNEARAKAGAGEPVRLWLAKAETLRLVALKKVAGRPEWNLEQQDHDGLLHWLYDPDEKVLEHQDTLLNTKIVGEDEKRLGHNVDRFVDHDSRICPSCGKIHSTP
jgi:hypothetical protein